MKTFKVLVVFLLIFIMIFIMWIVFYFLDLLRNIDRDYQKLGIEIEEYDIDYYTVYLEDILGIYKVYKINDYYREDSIDKIKEQLENSQVWSRKKFYEYIMMRFFEIENNNIVEIDREDLYYYHEKDLYAIIDVKNAKLYYYKYCILGTSKDFSQILDIKIDNYQAKEVYSVKGGWQGDGTDYYVYKFTKEKGEEIQEELSQSYKWSKEILSEEILESFEYNEEVMSIKNGYYFYQKVCRTSDVNKKYNFTDEEATGYEVGVYDVDSNLFYYYWTSY